MVATMCRAVTATTWEIADDSLCLFVSSQLGSQQFETEPQHSIECNLISNV
jgi:hypothetical protein